VTVTVYLDTSFLMLSAKFHIDVISESERLLQQTVTFVVPAAVVSELKVLSRDGGGSGRDARVALELIDERNIRIVPSGQDADADNTLVKASQLQKVLVATADNQLRKKIRAAKKPVIFFREKAKLELEGIEAGYW